MALITIISEEEEIGIDFWRPIIHDGCISEEEEEEEEEDEEEEEEEEEEIINKNASRQMPGAARSVPRKKLTGFLAFGQHLVTRI